MFNIKYIYMYIIYTIYTYIILYFAFNINIKYVCKNVNQYGRPSSKENIP